MTLRKVLFAVLGALLLLYFCPKLVSSFGAGIRSVFSEPNIDDVYVAAAKEVVANTLKNPATANYNNAAIYEKDNYGRAIVYVDVSAQNGFGGYVRDEFYVCINKATAEGNYSYSKTLSYVTTTALLDSLKEINQFGKPPTD